MFMTGVLCTVCGAQVYLFFARSENQPPQPLMGETFSTSPLKLLNKIQRNTTVSRISTTSTKFVGVIWINQDCRPTSDWVRHFRLLLWNRLMEFNETWQEARSQCPLPSICFSSLSGVCLSVNKSDHKVFLPQLLSPSSDIDHISHNCVMAEECALTLM